MTITIGSRNLNLNDFESIIFKKEKITLDKQKLIECNKSHDFLLKFSKDKVIYGINTGFGPMAPYIIEADKQIELQYNLIRSHSSGAGRWLDHHKVRAVMLSRLNSLMTGYSGVHISVLNLIKDLLNKEIYPLIPEHGGVGASGDLVQLSHLGLVLIGEGEVNFRGKAMSTKKVFRLTKLEPIKIILREGLAIINGTSAMTGIGTVNLIYAKRLVNWSIVASSMLQDIFQVYDDSFSAELNGVKSHPGQIAVAKKMRTILNGSKRIRKRHDYLYDKKINEKVLNEKVQEFYSVRCVPQIIGPILQTVENCEKVVLDEANSSSDNPVIDWKKRNVFHGGNFHGDYVSLEMDKLKIAVTKLSMLSERQLAFILNDNLTKILPPFVNLGTLGLNLGMQGVQFTATSTVAENQTFSFPMYVHSIPTNKDNQDIVSMGTNAANIANQVIDNSYYVLAIEFMGLLQAIDYLKIDREMSKSLFNNYAEMRKIVPKFKKDAVRYKEIKNLKMFLAKNDSKN